MYSGLRLKADLAQGVHSVEGEPLLRQSSIAPILNVPEEFRPTWQCVLDRRRIMGQSGLFLQGNAGSPD
jgi:hypothetical protein